MGIVPDNSFVSEAEKFADAWPGKIKVLVCEPTIGQINYRAHESICDMMSAHGRLEAVSEYKFFKSCLGRLLPQIAREQFAEYALNIGFDFIFYIDDDHIFDPDTFAKLSKWLKDYDIVAPLCCQRSKPYNPVIYKTKLEEEDNGRTTFDNKLYVDSKEIKKGDVITDADAIGFGCAIVKVELLKRVPRPWFMSMAPIGEDILFCAKASKYAKAKILVDTNVEAPHIAEGPIIDFRDYQREKQITTETRKNGEAEMGGSEPR